MTPSPIAQAIESCWKRLHHLPRAYDRAGMPGLSMYEQCLGPRLAGRETARQRYIRERSEARYSVRPDAYEAGARPLFKGEIGTYEGMRFIPSTPEPLIDMWFSENAARTAMAGAPLWIGMDFGVEHCPPGTCVRTPACLPGRACKGK